MIFQRIRLSLVLAFFGPGVVGIILVVVSSVLTVEGMNLISGRVSMVGGLGFISLLTAEGIGISISVRGRILTVVGIGVCVFLTRALV